MRADFILPSMLAVALAGMAVYATSERTDEAALHTTPLSCTSSAVTASLRDLPEASGLAASQSNAELFWAHNDSAEPYVFAVAGDGSARGRIRVAGASVFDWEAVTTAPCSGGTCLFVGDIGDNDRRRRSIMIYRVPEPSPSEKATKDATAIEASYPEGPQDAEAMFFADDHLFIVTKGEGTPARLYRLPSIDESSPQTLQLVATLTNGAPDKPYRITDAAISPDGRWVAMRTNDLVLFYDRAPLLGGAPGTALSFDLRGLREPQGEGVAWSDAGTLLLVGEAEGAGTFARISCNLPS
jgi:hypothetical protein